MQNLPIELSKAREARTEAWDVYMQVIDRPHTAEEFRQALHNAGVADKVANNWYDRWQTVGGTSDIESIVDAEQFLKAVETCLVDPAHIAISDALMIGWNSAPEQVGSSINWHNLIIFDVSAMAENANRNSNEMKARIDERMAEARARMGERH